MAKQTIFEIMGDYHKLFEMASDEELTKEFLEALETTKECLDYTLEEKAYNYAKVCKNLDFKKASLEGQKKYLKEMLEDTEKKIKAIDNNKKTVLNSLGEAMELADIPKFKNEQFTIYFTTTESVEVFDNEKALENNMATTEIKPDKKAIKEAIKSGEELDFARLNKKKSLVIR